MSDTTSLPERSSELVEKWAARDAAVPLDMLAKYCHNRLCAAHAARLVAVETDGVRVRPEHGDDFVGMLIEDGALRDFPRLYAGGCLDEPSCKRQSLGSDPTDLRGR